MTTGRRQFLTSLGATAAAAALAPPSLHAAPTVSAWDTSWLDALAHARFRAVINGSDIADGSPLPQFVLAVPAVAVIALGIVPSVIVPLLEEAGVLTW